MFYYLVVGVNSYFFVYCYEQEVVVIIELFVIDKCMVGIYGLFMKLVFWWWGIGLVLMVYVMDFVVKNGFENFILYVFEDGLGIY